MTSPRPLSARKVLAGLIGASILAGGLTLLVAHASTAASPTAVLNVVPAAASPSPSTSPQPGKHPRAPFGRPGFAAGVPGLGGVGPGELLRLIAKETGVTPQQIVTDIRGGKTLADIAGSSKDKVKADAITAVTGMLDKLVSKNVITKDAEQHLIADASDAIDQLMNAKLGNAGFGLPVPGKHLPGLVKPSPSASASATS
jgi:hypothetical protein